MGDRAEKLIKPIRDVCCEIPKDAKIADHIEKLKKITKGSAYLESSALVELLGVMDSLSSKDSEKFDQILIFLNEILNQNQNYLYNLNRLCRFITNFKVKPQSSSRESEIYE